MFQGCFGSYMLIRTHNRLLWAVMNIDLTEVCVRSTTSGWGALTNDRMTMSGLHVFVFAAVVARFLNFHQEQLLQNPSAFCYR